MKVFDDYQVLVQMRGLMKRYDVNIDTRKRKHRFFIELFKEGVRFEAGWLRERSLDRAFLNFCIKNGRRLREEPTYNGQHGRRYTMYKNIFLDGCRAYHILGDLLFE